MTIRKDKNNSEILVVDTLKDLLQLLANHEIWVRFSDTSASLILLACIVPI